MSALQVNGAASSFLLSYEEFGRKYFLTFFASGTDITFVPRKFRICLLVFLIMPCRLPACPLMTLPLPDNLKRFFAPDFVFIFGMAKSHDQFARSVIERWRYLQKKFPERSHVHNFNEPFWSALRQVVHPAAL